MHNVWGQLINRTAPAPQCELPSRVHSTAEPADPPPAKPAGPQLEQVWPAPKRSLSYPEAIAIRARYRNKQPVNWQEVQEADRVVTEARRNAMLSRFSDSDGGER